MRAGGATWIGQILYRVGRALVALLLTVVTGTRIEGAARVPRRGPLLVVANHTSNVDPLLLARAMPRPLAFLAKEELFHPMPWGWALRAAGIIPVRRGHADRQALDAALEVLRAGGALVVFPEGTRSVEGGLQAAQPGAGLLASRSGALVLPVALLGTERLHSPRGWLGRPRLLARCGTAWLPARPEGGGSRAYRAIADEMMQHIAALMPEGQRGRYGAGRVPTADPGAGHVGLGARHSVTEGETNWR